MGSFIRAFGSIFWAFLGVRKGSDREKDFESLNVVHVIVAGIISAALFVGLLMLIIHWIIPTHHS